jgi:hypothetical protein
MSLHQSPVELESSDSVILCSERHSTPSSHIHRLSWFCPARSVSQSHLKIRKMAKSSTLGRTNEQTTLSFVRHCDSLHSFTEPTATYPIAREIPKPTRSSSTTRSATSRRISCAVNFGRPAKLAVQKPPLALTPTKLEHVHFVPARRWLCSSWTTIPTRL